MEELDGKISKLLEAKKQSMPISEITKEIKDASKQEITRKLSEMNRQGIIYRKIKEGKSYYSINPEDGEGRNALQEHINKIAFLNSENKQDLNDFNKTNESLGINTNSNGLEDVEIMNIFKLGFVDLDPKNLEYNKNICFENDTYKMKIPDSFEYLPSVNDRDFIAYLPKKNLPKKLSYEEGGANIIIYSSTIIPFLNNKKRIAEAKRMLYDVVFWNGGYTLFERLGGEPEYKAVDLKSGRTGVIYMKFGTAHNFYFMCCLKNGFKQMRIVIEGVNGTKEEIEKIAIALMNKFEVKEQVNDFYELDDKKYLTNNISKDLVNDWVSNIKGIQISLNEYFQIFAKLLSLKMNVMKSKDIFNLVKFKSEIRDELKKYVLLIEKHIKNGENFINHLKSIKSPNDLTVPIYYCFKQFLKRKEFNINFEDGSTITQKVILADEVEKRIFDNEIMELISGYSDDDYNEKVDNSEDTKQENTELIEYCDELLKQARKDLKRLRGDWKFTQNEYIDGLNSKTIQSEYELKWEIKNIKQAARSFGHQYDDFLTELDKKGKKLLRQGANYLFIDGINDIISDVFDAFLDLHLSFSTHGTAYMDLGTFDYDIPDELYDIKYWWKNEYDKNPEVVKKREQEKKEKEEKLQKAKEQKEKFLSDISRDLKEEQQNFGNETKEIQEELEFEKKKIEKEHNSLKNEQLDKLKKEKDDIISDLKKNMELLKKENKSKEDEFSKLGILKFIQKDRLKTEIDINKQNIEKYSEQITNADADYKKERDRLINSIDDECNKKMVDLEQTFKMPTNPKDIIEKLSNILSKTLQTFVRNNRYVSKFQEENEKIKQKIYKTLIKLDKPVTVQDLENANMELSDYSHQKICALLMQMTKSNSVFKFVDNHKTYFEIGDESHYPSFNNSDYSTINSNLNKELIDKNRNNSYSKTRREIYELFKYTKTINPIEKDKIAKIKDLSMLRIYQILFSLEDDGLISKSIKDGTIIFNVK